MCVIAIKPINFSFKRDDIVNMHRANPNGFGVMWSENGELKTAKFLPKNAESAWKAYKNLPIHDVSAVLHFRWATHGSVCESNTHPFEVIPGLAMMHNGVISGPNMLDVRDVTDTQIYIERFIRPLLLGAMDPLELIRSPALKELIGKHIGQSKLAFLDKNGHVTIVNRELGTEIVRKSKRIWVSNDYWCDRSEWDHTATPIDTWVDDAISAVMAYDAIDLTECISRHELVVFAHKNRVKADDMLDYYQRGFMSVDDFINQITKDY